MTETPQFPATLEAALERLAAVDLAQYSRTRNALNGAVSRLSPYITHGFLTLPGIYEFLSARHPREFRSDREWQHKFVYELGWREYGRHLWHFHGDGIFRSLHPGLLPDEKYVQVLPEDIRTASTAIPVIDRAVRTLYDTGYLHNHARMWLASYVIHVRKIHWRAGADWMVEYLLDGDLASNHLSWQWIAATASRKPYLFNADNVARYAPASWHSPGTVIDTSYEALDAIAHGRVTVPTPTTPVSRDAIALPPVTPTPPLPRDAIALPPVTPTTPGAMSPPPTFSAPPPGLQVHAPDPMLVAGRHVWLVHPWALRAPPPELQLPADTLLVGVFLADFHRRWPWSLARWIFVCTRMQALTPHCWFADAATTADALRGARSVATVADPHFSLANLPALHTLPAPRLFADVDRPCKSFSQWWNRVASAIPSRPGDLTA